MSSGLTADFEELATGGAALSQIAQELNDSGRALRAALASAAGAVGDPALTHLVDDLAALASRVADDVADVVAFLQSGTSAAIHTYRQTDTELAQHVDVT